MIGIVVVSHGDLAAQFVAVLEHVLGKQEQITAIGIDADDDMESRRTDMVSAVQKMNDGDGVIVLTDMFGGTPSNMAISIIEQENIEVLAGVNLPLLIKLATLRKQSSDIQSVVSQACDAGRKYINVASQILEE